MKYSVADFYFLTSAADLKAKTVETAYESMCTYMGYPVSMTCLLRTIHDLVAGGYITVVPDEGNVISATTPLTVTPSGKKLVAISPIQRLLGEHKAHLKNLMCFCDMECPKVPENGMTADKSSFEAAVTRLIRAGDITLPMFEISDLADGYLKLTIHHPNDGWQSYDESDENGEEETDPDAGELSYSASVTGTVEQITAGLRDLIETAYLLVTKASPRKVALHGQDGSLLIALANAANEQGLVTFRMTVSRIRFNRQRFVGKRDSDLDYAQCGDPIFIHEMRSAGDFAYYDVLHSVFARPDLLRAEDCDALQEIYRRAR